MLSPILAAAELRLIDGAVRQIVRAEQPDVVQTHLLGSLDFVPLGVRRSGRPAVLWTVHNAILDLRPDQLPPGQRWLLGMKRAAFRLAYGAGGRIADGFVAVSDDVADAVRRAYRPPADHLFVIPNGVDTDRHSRPEARARVRADLGVEPDALVLVVVAKLFRQKGHQVLLEALSFTRLPAGHAILLVGDGPERDALDSRAAALGLGAIRFLGNRSDVPDLLAASDLFVLPSLWEGLPMALLEAMAAGLPVIATDVAGSRQVLAHGASGLVVPPGDAEALAVAIGNLAVDTAARRRLGDAARERVRAEFSAARQAERHAAAYQVVLDRQRS